MPNKVKLGSAFYKLLKQKGLIKDHDLIPAPAFTQRKSVLERDGHSHQAKTKIPSDWSHDAYGEVFGASACDLIRLFPQQNLNESGLSRVRRGKQISHKGWSILKSKPQEKNVIIMGSVPVSEEKDNSNYYQDLVRRGS